MRIQEKMIELRVLHSEAMDLAERAMIDRARGRITSAQKHLKEALKKERRAAEMAVKQHAPEPTRSILLKSAAHLAIDAGELRLAERMIGIAFAGEPPEELAHELRSLFEELGFRRHLDLHGVELHSNDCQMVLVGHAIAPGMAASNEFVKRVETVQKLIYRTSESDESTEYRDRGDPVEEIQKPLQLFVSVPRAASFAVSLKVASEKDQGEFRFARSADVLDRLLDRLAMFDRSEYEALSKAIPTKPYFDNFIKLASELAPDGERVRMVGFTTIRGDTEKRLEMRRPAQADAKDEAFVPSVKIEPFEGRVVLINTKDEDNMIIKLETADKGDLRLRAEGDLLQRAAMYAVRKSRVLVRGIQISKTSVQVKEFKAIRGRRPTRKRR